MILPMIDAEALREFLEKSAPYSGPEQDSRIADGLIGIRRRGYDLLQRFAAGEEGPLPPEVWEVTAGARKVPAERRAGFEPLLADLLRAAGGSSSKDVWDRFESGERAQPWLLEWTTFWLWVRDPAREMWWARHTYNAAARTGSILLLSADPDAYDGTLPARELYQMLNGSARMLSAILESTKLMAGIPEEDRTTVALARVYAVYLFTMAAWRMTTEFTKVFPPFARVVESLLGMRRWGGVESEQGEVRRDSGDRVGGGPPLSAVDANVRTARHQRVRPDGPG